MLKGTRRGVVQRTQTISVHGQLSTDVFWIDPEDPEQELRHSRVGNEAMPRDLSPGDQVTMHYLMGMVTQITK
jgi:hypothetical protein